MARPASKSLPIILSKLMNTCITFDMKGAGPLITQFRLVALACGSIVNSGTFWGSKRLEEIELDQHLRRRIGLEDFHAAGTDVLVTPPGIDRALAALGAAIGPLQRGIAVFPGRTF